MFNVVTRSDQGGTVGRMDEEGNERDGSQAGGSEPSDLTVCSFVFVVQPFSSKTTIGKRLSVISFLVEKVCFHYWKVLVIDCS